MRITKNDVPEKINIPGAIARQVTEFGDATGYGKIAGEYFSLAAGVDIAPLLKGLEDDLCQSPHWGYLIEGEVTVTHGWLERPRPRRRSFLLAPRPYRRGFQGRRNHSL